MSLLVLLPLRLVPKLINLRFLMAKGTLMQWDSQVFKFWIDLSQP